ncbi:TPA: lipoprotein, partial [Escherichia coli]
EPVCIDISELSSDVMYIGKYMLSSGSKKEYYGFSIIRTGERILRLDDNHIK